MTPTDEAEAELRDAVSDVRSDVRSVRQTLEEVVVPTLIRLTKQVEHHDRDIAHFRGGLVATRYWGGAVLVAVGVIEVLRWVVPGG